MLMPSLAAGGSSGPWDSSQPPRPPQGSLMGEVVLAASALSRRDRFRSVDDAIATLGAVKPYKFMQR